jgi:hypothetical protein
MLRALLAAATAGLLAGAAACSRSLPATDAPVITLVAPSDGASYVEVTGLSASTLDAVNNASLTPQEWTRVLRVGVADDGPPVLGAYARQQDTLRFTPAFPFDPGRPYKVRVDLSRVPGRTPGTASVVTSQVTRQTTARQPTTVVQQVYPSSGEVPENLLRMYVEFSAPMARYGGVASVHLFDDAGKEVKGAFLPLDYEFWSSDRRRFTVFFDPGRVKDGILPNKEMGRALMAGREYTLVVAQDWRDEHGLPLVREYRQTLRVGQAFNDGLTPSKWRISAPAAGTRAPLVVTFPHPLDHGLLMRALGVRLGDDDVAGDVQVAPGETRWQFTPERPWTAGAYDLLALSILEDPAGNRIGRPFEIENFGPLDSSPAAQTVRVPFKVSES